MTKDYISHRWRLKAGAIIELDDNDALWLERDSVGALQEIRPPEPEPVPVAVPIVERVMDAPPADRMVRRGRKRKAGV